MFKNSNVYTHIHKYKLIHRAMQSYVLIFYNLLPLIIKKIIMKKLFALVSGLLFCSLLFAQGGVEFQHLTYSEALKKAEATNKLVFVDCYTTWCGPCRQMTEVIFPQKAAGEFFNSRFVCVKFDMEKEEGKELSKKLGVRAYPTFVIVRPDGTIQHRIVGGGELDEFIERVQLGLDEKTNLLYLTERYNSGKMKKAEMAIYCRVLNDAYDSKMAKKVLGELKEKVSKKDMIKAEYWSLFEMGNCGLGSDDFNFVLSNYSALVKNVGKEKVDNFIYNNYSDVLRSYISGTMPENTPDVTTLEKEIRKLQIAQKNQLQNAFIIANLVVEKNAAEIVKLMEGQVETMTFEDFVNFFIAQNSLKKYMTKEMYNRMLAVAEKMNGRVEEGNQKKYTSTVIDILKKKAHIGVYFEDLTFNQALKKVRMNRQLLFVDCYTSWCGPCKYMTSKIFPQEKMGDYLNRFVCVKYDMEKGEGPELAKRFGVVAYPTFLLIDTDGNVRHKVVGGGEPDSFIKRIEEAFDENKATGILEAKYKAGNRDHVFLANYVQMLVATYGKNADVVADELFQSLSDEEKVAKEYWFLYTNAKLSPEGSAAYNYLLNNRDKFIQSLGAEVVEQHFFNMYNARLNKVLNANFGSIKVDSIDRLKKEIVALKLTDDKALLAKTAIARAFWGGNQNQLLLAVEKGVKVIPSEQFPINLAYRVKDNLTSAQLNRWVKICETVIANCKYSGTAKRMQGILDYLKKK